MNEMPGLDLTLNEDGTICLPDGRRRTVHDGSSKKHFQELLENIDQPIQMILRAGADGMKNRIIVALSEREQDGPPESGMRGYLQKLGQARSKKESWNADDQRIQSEVLASMLERYGFGRVSQKTTYELLHDGAPFTARSRSTARLALAQSDPIGPDALDWTLLTSEWDGSDFGQDYFAGRSITTYPALAEPGGTSAWMHKIAQSHHVTVSLAAFIVPADSAMAIQRLQRRLAALEDEQRAGTLHLIETLERNIGKLVQMTMHIGLSGEMDDVQTAMRHMDAEQEIFGTRSHNGRHIEARISTLPVGVHALSASHAARFVLANAAAAMVS